MIPSGSRSITAGWRQVGCPRRCCSSSRRRSTRAASRWHGRHPAALLPPAPGGGAGGRSRHHHGRSFRTGIGAGFSPSDFAAFGVAPASKRDRLREGLDILQQAWTGETFSYHGEHYHIEKGRLAPTPPRPWRDLVWLAASHTDTAQMAGERDMHLMLSRGNPVSLSQTLIATYQASLRQAGHRTDDRFTQKTWMVYVSDSEADALAMGERGARGYYEHTLRLRRPRVANDDDLAVCLAQVDMLIGTPEQVADELPASPRTGADAYRAAHALPADSPRQAAALDRVAGPRGPAEGARGIRERSGRLSRLKRASTAERRPGRRSRPRRRTLSRGP
ncbi:MAG: LLM class flavin-dependent oxidoreductase [Anaerolineae bacterium]|nr:LLM class flavin-dependent oxidoreductase [Anaerolineae bacterium]